MLAISIETLSDLTVIECRGRIIRSDDVFKLRNAVMAQSSAHIIALDLSEVKEMGGGGLGMLVFLEHWARNCEIHLKLYGPSKTILEGLVRNRSIQNFEIATFHEMMGILAHSDTHYSLAA